MFEQLTPNSGTSSGHSPDGSGEGGHANSAKIQHIDNEFGL